MSAAATRRATKSRAISVSIAPDFTKVARNLDPRLLDNPERMMLQFLLELGRQLDDVVMPAIRRQTAVRTGQLQRAWRLSRIGKYTLTVNVAGPKRRGKPALYNQWVKYVDPFPDGGTPREVVERVLQRELQGCVDRALEIAIEELRERLEL